jgi:hypothetical protein
LETLGNTWKHLETLGNTCEHLEALGNTWKHLETLGNTWKHLETFGNTWNGNTWKHLETLGNTWKHLETFGHIWKHLVKLGNIRIPMFPNVSKGFQLETVGDCKVLLWMNVTIAKLYRQLDYGLILGTGFPDGHQIYHLSARNHIAGQKLTGSTWLSAGNHICTSSALNMGPTSTAKLSSLVFMH